jgi:hypothetical protein
MPNLYELTDEIQSIQNAYESGDIPEEAFADTLEGVQMEFDAKVENICKLRANLLADSAAYKAEKERLATRETAAKNEATRLQNYLLNALQTTGQKKIKVGTFTASIAKSPAALVILDESLIPKNYRIPQPDKIDNAAIKGIIKSGQSVPGAELKQGEYLKIR